MDFPWGARDINLIRKTTDWHNSGERSFELNVQYCSQKVPRVSIETNGDREEWDHGQVSSQVDQESWGPWSKFPKEGTVGEFVRVGSRKCHTVWCDAGLKNCWDQSPRLVQSALPDWFWGFSRLEEFRCTELLTRIDFKSRLPKKWQIEYADERESKQYF